MEAIHVADLIRMSEATALGLHTMAIIAESESPISTAQVAATLRASETHLSKVLQQLTRVGLLNSKRGPTGGYLLARPPDSINLLDVYEALEGPLRRDGCLFAEPICDQVHCMLGSLIEQLRNETHAYLSTTSLHDVVQRARR